MVTSLRQGAPTDGPSRRRLLGQVLASALGALPLALQAQSPRTLAVFGDDSYPPVIHLAQGRPRGFLVEVLERVEPRLQVRFELQLMPWKRAYVLALREQGGLIGVSRNQERDGLFDFSRPIYNDDIRVVVLKGHGFPFKDLPDLRGRRIGGVSGASYGERVDAAIRDGLFTVERDIGQVSRLRKLLAGRLDAAFIGNGERGFEWQLASHPELQAHRDQFELLPVPLARDPLHLAFPKALQQRDFLAQFDQLTKELRLQA
jgi:polar amino acid transport system substrate-binding protein